MEQNENVEIREDGSLFDILPDEELLALSDKLVYSQKELSDFGFAIAAGTLSMEGVRDWLIGKAVGTS